VISKTNGNGGPQLTWPAVFGAVGVFCLITGGGYAILQNQFNAANQLDKSLREAAQHEQEIVNKTFSDRLSALEIGQRELIAHAAHSPVEAKEVDGLSASVDKQIAALRSQIDDINRQIAASILLQPQHIQPPSTQR